MGVLEDTLGVNTQDMGEDSLREAKDPYDPVAENHRILQGEYLPPYGYHVRHILTHVENADSTDFAPSGPADRERLFRHVQEHLREWLIEGKEKTKGPPTIQEAVHEVMKHRVNVRGV